MSEYAPAAIRATYDKIEAVIPAAQLSGIQGDSAHTYGYHRGRNYVSGSDYSVQQSDDKQGSGEAACGLDISFPADWMKTVTKRLIAAVDAGEADGRLLALREFYGTTDGNTVTGRDVRSGNWVTSDDSHLWHIHASIYRRWADDEKTLAGIADVITGTDSGSGGNDDMGTFETRTHGVRQTLTSDWKTLHIDEDAVTWMNGPCEFQAQANLSFEGLAAGSAVKLRWFSDDVRGSDGHTTSHVNAWPTVEVIGTSGSTAASVVQFGKMYTPESGWTRRLRLEAYSDAESGVAVTYVRASSFRQ
jgi:hypothetical protein